MPLGPYLIRRGGGLVFSRRVPKGHARRFRSAFLRVPLQTHLLSEGRRRARRAADFLDAAFAMLGRDGATMLDQATTERVTLALMRFELDAAERLRAVAPRRGPSDVDAALRLHAATRETLERALVYNDYDAVRDPLRATLARLGVEVEEDGTDWRLLARDAARALLDVADENARRETGRYAPRPDRIAAAEAVRPDAMGISYPVPSRRVEPAQAFRLEQAPAPVAPLMARDLADADDAFVAAPLPRRVPAAPVARTGVRGGAPAASAGCGVHLRDAAERYVRHMRETRGKSWETNSEGNFRSAMTLLMEVHGDRDLAFFTTERLREMTSVLRATPKHHHKGHTGAPVRELIAEADAREMVETACLKAELEAAGADRGTIETALAAARVKRLKIATIYRHQQDQQRLFAWAVDQGLLASNPMKGVIWSKGQVEALQREEADGKRLPWGEKAKLLFSSRIFVDPLENPGDALFWAPVLAYLAGLRMEEALQLKASDFETIDGVPCIRIRQGEGQHLKNAYARRIVPIHPALLDLGLLDLVAHRRAEGQAWLFPDVDRSASRGRLSGTFTKAFFEYRVAEGLYDPLRPFHSLRADFNVVMKRAFAPIDARKQLMGHKIVDVTDGDYDPEGNPVGVLLDQVRKIGFDASGIRRPFGPATADPQPRLRIVS